MTDAQAKATSLLEQAGIVCEHVVVTGNGMLIRPTPETLSVAQEFLGQCASFKNVRTAWNTFVSRTVLMADWA